MCCSGHFVETCLAHASCGFGETCKLFFGNTCDNSCSNPFLMSATSSHHESEGKKQKIFGACMLRHHDIPRKAVRCREPYSHTKDIIRFLRWEILLYRGTAPGNGHWTKSRSFFIEAQLLATVIGQNHDPSLRGTALGRNLWTEITILLYRGTAPGNGPWTKSRCFFIEAQLLETVLGQNHDPSL